MYAYVHLRAPAIVVFRPIITTGQASPFGYDNAACLLFGISLYLPSGGNDIYFLRLLRQDDHVMIKNIAMSGLFLLLRVNCVSKEAVMCT